MSNGYILVITDVCFIIIYYANYINTFRSTQ